MNCGMVQFWRNTADNIRTVLGVAEPVPGSAIPRDARSPANISVGKRLCKPARPDWGAATVMIPWTGYFVLSGSGSVSESWSMMQDWIALMEGYTVQDGMISEGYGDWCPPGFKQDTPVSLTSTALFYASLKAMTQMGLALGFVEEAERSARRADEIKAPLTRPFTTLRPEATDRKPVTLLCCFTDLYHRRMRRRLRRTWFRKSWKVLKDMGAQGSLVAVRSIRC